MGIHHEIDDLTNTTTSSTMKIVSVPENHNNIADDSSVNAVDLDSEELDTTIEGAHELTGKAANMAILRAHVKDAHRQAIMRSFIEKTKFVVHENILIDTALINTVKKTLIDEILLSSKNAAIENNLAEAIHRYETADYLDEDDKDSALLQAYKRSKNLSPQLTDLFNKLTDVITMNNNRRFGDAFYNLKVAKLDRSAALLQIEKEKMTASEDSDKKIMALQEQAAIQVTIISKSIKEMQYYRLSVASIKKLKDIQQFLSNQADSHLSPAHDQSLPDPMPLKNVLVRKSTQLTDSDSFSATLISSNSFSDDGEEEQAPQTFIQRHKIMVAMVGLGLALGGVISVFIPPAIPFVAGLLFYSANSLLIQAACAAFITAITTVVGAVSGLVLSVQASRAAKQEALLVPDSENLNARLLTEDSHSYNDNISDDELDSPTLENTNYTLDINAIACESETPNSTQVMNTLLNNDSLVQSVAHTASPAKAEDPYSISPCFLPKPHLSIESIEPIKKAAPKKIHSYLSTQIYTTDADIPPRRRSYQVPPASKDDAPIQTSTFTK